MMKMKEQVADYIYDQIYEGKLTKTKFEEWLNHQLKLAYDRGLIDGDADDGWDDISKSQYD